MNFYKMYFRKVPSKGYYVALKVIEKSYKLNRLNNISEDDDSENYEIIFTEEQINDIRLFKHCANVFPGSKGIEGFDIYGVDIRIIEAECEYEGNLHMNNSICCNTKINKESQYICHFLGNQYQIHLSDKEKENVKKIKDILKEKFHLDNDIKLGEFLRREYMIPMQDEWGRCSKLISKYYVDKKTERFKELCEKNNIDLPNILDDLYNNPILHENIRKFDRNLMEPIKREYNKIYEQLLLEKKVPAKWTSEFELFKLVKKYFSDAIFQYSPDWLFPQRFDIYVPSIMTAFEYQGIQHFQNIGFFGGEDGLKKRILLDKKKKEKCELNGTILIEWIYDENINKITLNEKLKQKGLFKI
ncbi:hypothetical protein [Clostridium tyrobutyricum]|uniref:hypothetical protein n=1 Tax=Clostridium tyrobutyricum TaxID=1519 RepID=UPI0030D0F583